MWPPRWTAITGPLTQVEEPQVEAASDRAGALKQFVTVGGHCWAPLVAGKARPLGRVTPPTSCGSTVTAIVRVCLSNHSQVPAPMVTKASGTTRVSGMRVNTEPLTGVRRRTAAPDRAGLVLTAIIPDRIVGTGLSFLLDPIEWDGRDGLHAFVLHDGGEVSIAFEEGSACAPIF